MQTRFPALSESQPLLSPPCGAASINSKTTSSVSVESNTYYYRSTCVKHLLSRFTCKSVTMATIIIILTNVFVSLFYSVIINTLTELGCLYDKMGHTSLILHSFMALFGLFYPISGFLADVYCGRYRVIFASVCLMFAACLILTLCDALIITIIEGGSINLQHLSDHGSMQSCVNTFIIIIVVVFLFGRTGYQANFIPFGLDQLLEAPSSSLALFIHWIIWADSIGKLIIQILIAVYICEVKSRIASTTADGYVIGYGSLILTALNFFVILSLKYCDFYSESGRHNPYKIVYKVLNFARKHKYPLQRSAFTYCDDELPSRVDFAKERFGGPFTTEQVEDVKTFLRILLVFVVLGTVFVLDVPTSNIVSFLFGIHISGEQSSAFNHSCSSRFILLTKGSLQNLVSVVILPLYMWIIFSALRRYAPSIFSRLILAVILHLLGVVSMLCIDLVGHHIAKESGNADNSMCMFIHISNPHLLHLHWAALLLPGILIGVGKPLVMATSFEFISAQSPSSMKGLLVGVLFCIRAVYQLVSGLALIPFSSESLWDSEHMREHPPVTNCGFGYLLFTCVVALIGLILLLVVARRYKYRERDDRPYDQRFAIAVIGRDIEERSSLEESA